MYNLPPSRDALLQHAKRVDHECPTEQSGNGKEVSMRLYGKLKGVQYIE